MATPQGTTMRFLETIKAIANFPVTDPSNMDAVNMQLMAQKAVAEYEALMAEPIPSADSCQAMGVAKDGSSVYIKDLPMPVKMKAAEIVRSYFGVIEEDSFNDAAMALQCCEETIAHMKKYSHYFAG